MKRGRPLRRGELKRGQELRANPEKVREFLKKRGGLSRGTKAKAEDEGPLSPAEWQRAVWMASGGRCIITRAKAANVEDRRFHAHHVLPKRVLRAHGCRDRVWDPRNGVLLHRDVHLRGLSREPDIPRSALPAGVWEFCRELDAREGSEWATSLVLRLYPNP